MCGPGCAAEAGWQETDCEEVVMGSATVQGQLWGTSPHDWAEVIEPMMRPVHLAALAALAPLSGLSLLDAGCGAGLALRLAAEQGARVSGLDASAALLDVARGRLPDADLRVGDIEELPYDDATFDVVTAYNSIQYAFDPKAAVAELTRVARPGGRAAGGGGGGALRARGVLRPAEGACSAPARDGRPAGALRARSRRGAADRGRPGAGRGGRGGLPVHLPRSAGRLAGPVFGGSAAAGDPARRRGDGTGGVRRSTRAVPSARWLVPAGERLQVRDRPQAWLTGWSPLAHSAILAG